MLKIAFGYKCGSGKDECCDYLTREYGGNKLSFASPIYDILKYTQLSCNFDCIKDRKFLQFVGEWARETDENVWVKILLKNSKRLRNNIYISDLRRINEFNALKQDGWICIKINRNLSEEETNKRLGNGYKNHDTEFQLDSYPDQMWDYIIENNETLEELYKKLDYLILKITIKKF